MLSLKMVIVIIGLIILAFLIFILYLFIDPFPMFYKEYEFIPSLSQWIIYFITVFIPLSVLLRIFFNPSAGRAINPVNKKFASTAPVIIFLVLISVIWFLLTNTILIPYLETYLYANISISGSSDIIYLLLIIVSIIGLPLLSVSIATPVKTTMALKSVLNIR